MKEDRHWCRHPLWVGGKVFHTCNRYWFKPLFDRRPR